MEKLNKVRFGYIYCFGVGVIAGILIGAATLNIILSYRIDTYHREIAQLQVDNRDKDIRLKKLEQSLNTQKYLLQDIEVILLFAPDGEDNTIDGVDEIERMEIESNIREKYVLLLGKEVEAIDADLVTEIVDKRIFKIGPREYMLHVVRLVLSETLKIWINVELID